ncbi:MAG: hypothetical protein V9F82_04565 [Dermatophilaceae bacterium]
MHGVGPGSLLGGRYAVRRRLTQQPRWERWSAEDCALDREVVLLCFPRDAGQTDAAVDAARRAAGIEEPRLTRVLDVGRDEAVVFVVEEPMPDAQTLTALLGSGGLPGDEVRRVVGEAATALAAAGARGLHHGVLTPRNVLVLPDGSVKVRGLAIEAALIGEEDPPPEQASRADALALVGLLYAGLTGRWPLPGPDSGLQAAARVVGGVVAPSEIAAGVPRDLDLLVTGALGSGHAPASPSDLVESLTPWSPVPVRELATERVAVLRPAMSTRTQPFARDPVSGGIRRPDAGGSTWAARSAGPGEGAARTGSVAATAGAVAGATGSLARGLGRGVAGAFGAAGTAAGTVAGKVGSVARQTADRAAERSAARAERHRFEHLDDAFFEGQEATLSEVLEPAVGQLEPPVPLLAVEGAPSSKGASRLALAIVAGLVLLVAVLGIWGLPELGSGAPALPASRASGGATGTGAPAASSTDVTGFVTAAIVGAATFDPANGGQLPASTGAKAYDGDPATAWRSSKWYGTAKFGGYDVPGLGLMLDLGQPTRIRRVKVTLPVEQDGKIYVASAASLEGATVIGAFTNQKGELSFEAPNGMIGSLVIVFVTRLGPDGEGHFRAQVSEVQVAT